MKRISTLAFVGVLATFAVTVASVTPAMAGSRQDNKNTWRNVGIASAVVGLFGLTQHNDTAAVIGALGAAYAGDRFEQDRQSQSQWRDRYYRNDGWDNRDNNRNFGTYDRDNNWNNRDNRNGDNRNERDSNNGGYRHHRE